MYTIDLSTTRKKYLDRLCYGLSQGIKLADATDPHKIGQHTEALRLSILWIIRQHPEDFQQDLVDAMNDANLSINLDPGFGEGGNKP